jgi:hypothetical protein
MLRSVVWQLHAGRKQGDQNHHHRCDTDDAQNAEYETPQAHKNLGTPPPPSSEE